LSQTAITLGGTTYSIKLISLYDPSQTIYFPTTSKNAIINAEFKSYKKSILDTEPEEMSEGAYFSVLIDSSNTGENFKTVISRQFVPNNGTFEGDIRKFLGSGNNKVKIEVTGAVSNQSDFMEYTVNLTAMYLADSNFNWNEPFIEGITRNFGGLEIGGNLNKTLYVLVTNPENGYEDLYSKKLGTHPYVESKYYITDLKFPGETGIYNLDIWVESDGFSTEHLNYNIICVAEANKSTAKLVAVNNVASTIPNNTGSSVNVFSYAIYNCGSTEASPIIKTILPDGQESEETLSVSTNTKHTYSYELSFESEDKDLVFSAGILFGNEINVSIPVDNSLSFPAAKGAVFYLNSSKRSNAQSNREKIINEVTGEEIEAT
jgi:hypothetical protein